MRNYQLLDTFSLEGEIAQLSQSDANAGQATVAIAREGERIALSISMGALELALRLNYPEVLRHLNALKPVPGLSATRHVGSGQAHIDLGMTEEGGLVLRPTLVTDATGHLTINLMTTKAVFEQFAAWLNKK